MKDRVVYVAAVVALVPWLFVLAPVLGPLVLLSKWWRRRGSRPQALQRIASMQRELRMAEEKLQDDRGRLCTMREDFRNARLMRKSENLRHRIYRLRCKHLELDQEGGLS